MGKQDQGSGKRALRGPQSLHGTFQLLPRCRVVIESFQHGDQTLRKHWVWPLQPRVLRKYRFHHPRDWCFCEQKWVILA